jgi:hypothetical protein
VHISVSANAGAHCCLLRRSSLKIENSVTSYSAAIQSQRAPAALQRRPNEAYTPQSQRINSPVASNVSPQQVWLYLLVSSARTSHADSYDSVPDLTKNVTIVINGDASFTVPESLLIEKSQYFTAACRGEWIEATSRVIKLQEIDAEAFNSYMYWIHRHELAINAKFDLKDVESVVTYVDKLVRLWLLGDRFDDCELRDIAMTALLVAFKEDQSSSFHTAVLPPSATVLIFSSLTNGRALQRLVLNHYIIRVWPRDMIQQWDEFHPDSIKSLAMGHLEPRYEGEVMRDDEESLEDEKEYCHYHEHSSVTMRCAEAILQKP